MDKAQGIVSFVQYFTYILQMDWISDFSNNKGYALYIVRTMLLAKAVQVFDFYPQNGIALVS
jgi:hypothetical protein